ncbi:hypothetical protein IFM61606_06418 [Aspergillus udagawae]|uniref:BZIP domain-containing protein n=1 Tax=Aspergillus udagawae TaxID=91492 RepID=A0ABQ1AT28_9EURO|nr:hypothetical protein IFM51744_07861 [Aspergillus udagawae]GFF87598.1 hypothetical protein IFM53868_05201 [Aspergillus udagawae]GFG12511.1 hypothetical protein IFM5058_05984 [Aspergillus udagawae]GFG26436.1 hypothetical protein IFM61606_06418 [Aspergillus udagawae]
MDTPLCDGQSDRQNTPESSPPVNHSKLLKRGRPRIERAGETAGERRKEQIRLAQRAYRFRKDLRIAALDQKVVELEQTILAIRDLYLGVHTSVVDSEIAVSHPFLVQSMQTNLQLLLCLTRSVSSRGAEYQPSSTYHSTDGSWNEDFLGRKTPLPSPPLSGQHPMSGSEPLRLPFDSTCTSPGEAPDVLPDQFALDPLLLYDEYFWEQPSTVMNNDEISLGHLTAHEFSSTHP